MPKTTTFQRASTMDLQPSIRRMGRPLRSAPLVSQRTESAHFPIVYPPLDANQHGGLPGPSNRGT